MMNIRDYSLPAGWYPRERNEIDRFLSGFGSGPARAGAAIAPHAGWFFSGRIAARAVSALDRQAETVVIIGGHLPAGSPPLCAMEDAAQTPLGIMRIDAELREALRGELTAREDRYRDNTVEVLLPMARFFFPDALLLWLRLPADRHAFAAGAAIAQTAERLGRKTVVLASTDLTHYGSNYGFTPRGGGPEALQWVREVNDARFIEAVEAGKPETALERAGREQSACSAGAVLGAMGFAQQSGLPAARLLEYGTSADALAARGEESPETFVGYAAFAFH